MHFQIIDCVDLRIEGGGHSGILECQLINGTWGAVCKTGFYSDEATAACKQLGYNQYNNYESV